MRMVIYAGELPNLELPQMDKRLFAFCGDERTVRSIDGMRSSPAHRVIRATKLFLAQSSDVDRFAEIHYQSGRTSGRLQGMC